MKSKSQNSELPPFRSGSGFTLIEVIATLMLASVLIALLLPLIGAGFTNRATPLAMPETHNLRSEMDALWHQYRTTAPVNLPVLSSELETAAAANPPYTLEYNDWVDFDAAGVEFIPPAGTQKVLRVTMGNSKGEQLTAYFFADQ